MTLKEAYDNIESYYRRLEIVGTTSGRKYNYEKICRVVDECPQVAQYWEIREEKRFYKDRVVKIRELVIITTVVEQEVYPVETLANSHACCSYILLLEDLDLIKVGKAKDFRKRLSQLRSQYGRITPLHLFEFNNEDDAYLMEVLLHKYYKEKYPNSSFIPQDRFGEAGLTVADLDILTKVAERIRTENWF